MGEASVSRPTSPGLVVKIVYEKVPKLQNSSFGAFRFKGSAFDAPYHYHPEIELTHILSGRGDLLVGDSYSQFSEGDLILQGPGLPHSYRSTVEAPASSCWIQFLPDALGQGFFDLPECRRIRRLLERAERGLRFSKGAAKAAAGILDSLPDLSGARRLTTLVELLETLSHDRGAETLASEGYAVVPSKPGMARVERLLRVIDRNWKEPLSLDAAAREVRLHPQSLSRFCQRYLRRSFKSLVIERRIGESARRLLETDDSVAEIAFACGFNNLSNFNRLFRSGYGISPRDYRRRASGGEVLNQQRMKWSKFSDPRS